MALIVGIDPGTGRSSDSGFAIIDPERRVIHYTARFGSKAKMPHMLYQELCVLLKRHIQVATDMHDPNTIFACETFVMRGKGGETLQRLIGAYMSHVPVGHHFYEVFNTTVKRLVSGHGAGDKDDVAIGIAAWLKGAATPDQDSLDKVEELRHLKAFDELDAIAIAIACHEQLKAEALLVSWKSETKTKVDMGGARRRRHGRATGLVNNNVKSTIPRRHSRLK